MKLSPTMEKYILHWGEMGTRWGVNRSVSQVHALLYLTEQPLPAEEIAETLDMARSNVSTSLKELVSWNIVSRIHVMGDRRDHFQAQGDLWQLLLTIVEGRKAREIDPTLAVLRQCVAESRNDIETPKAARDRMANMLDFMETMSAWYEQVSRLPKSVLIKLMKMGGRIAKFVGRDKENSDED